MEKKQKRNVFGGIDIPFLTIIFVMLAFGLIMVFSASAPSAFYNEGDKLYYIKRQLIWTVVGMGAMGGMIVIGHRFVKRYASIVFIISLVLLGLVLAIGSTGGGAQRWLAFGPIRFQPSELAKFALVFFFAKRMAEKPKNQIRQFTHGLLPYLFILGLMVGIMILQDHLSGAVIIFMTGIIMLVAGGARLSHLGLIMLAGLAVLVPAAFLEEYRLKRLMAFRNPFADPTDTGYQIVQGLYAIASGGLFGLGLGQSRQKFLYIPEAHNDYIYAIICEELGFVGAALVAVLFVLLITRGVYIAMHAPDTFSSLTVFGIISIIGLQYLINVGVVTGTIPNTGMQLPFFSAGGSSLIFIMAAMGVVLSISREIKRKGQSVREGGKK
ncbi:MAG: putative lipid II flippase FtsW [Ruminococcaceae bacterium]|nr:putative lipid II flippase FtsW [Oscillospiraceae bacterium]